MKPHHALLAAAALMLAAGAHAQQTIDHNKALAGHVTPGDAPGYPVTLSQPGYYKLMSNLVVPADTTGIQITAANVTLDLNGFTISGPVSCAQNQGTRIVTCSQTAYVDTLIATASGIVMEPTALGSVVRNGTVRGFRGAGILVKGGESIKDMRVTENAADGIIGSGSIEAGTQVADSLVDLNGRNGISVDYGLVLRSRIVSNGSHGVWGIGALGVYDSLVRKNQGIGLSQVVVRGTVSTNNGSNRSNVKSLGGNLDAGTVY